jgi:hypothetical protein
MSAVVLAAAVVGIFFIIGLVVGAIVVIALPTLKRPRGLAGTSGCSPVAAWFSGRRRRPADTDTSEPGRWA